MRITEHLLPFANGETFYALLQSDSQLQESLRIVFQQGLSLIPDHELVPFIQKILDNAIEDENHKLIRTWRMFLIR